MIDDLWSHCSTPSFVAAERQFHIQFANYLQERSNWTGWVDDAYEGNWEKWDSKLHTKAWKDCSPARIFTEWWYCCGHRCAEQPWYKALEFFAENFRSASSGEASALVAIKLMSIVFWGTSNPYDKTKNIWYKQFEGSSTVNWMNIYFPFALMIEPTASVQTLDSLFYEKLDFSKRSK